jgi:multiple sugar transport system substrate-binding protein
MKKVAFMACLILLTVNYTSWANGGGQKDGGPTVIKVWSNDAHTKIQCTEMIDKFHKTTGAQKNILIEYTILGGDYYTALDVALAANEEPDIFKANPKTLQFVEMGKLLPLRELPNFEEYMKEYAPYQIEGWDMINGVVYNLPLYQGTFGMAYNKEILARIGFKEPPKTWDEFEKACIAASKLEPGKIYGNAIPLKDVHMYDSYILNFIVPSYGHFIFDSSTGRYKAVDYAPFFEMLSRIKKAGAMFPGMETMDDDTARAQFAEGNIAFIISGSWNVGVWYDQFPAKMDWGVVPVPVQDIGTASKGVSHIGTMWAVTNQVKKRNNMDAVAEVLKLFTSKEIRKMNYTAGKHLLVDPQLTREAAPCDRPQWNEFGEISTNTVLKPSPPDALITVEGDDYRTVFAKILVGLGDAAAFLADCEKRYNEALDKAVAAGKIKRESYIDPSIAQRFRGD